MSTLVIDPTLSARLIAQRHERGADAFDEVWYVLAPAPNDEHQSIATRLARVLVEVIGDDALGKVRNTINLAANVDDWDQDYRVPSVAVFLNGSSAVCHGAFWAGGPDLVVEIVSPYDRTREKIDFYERIGACELLNVDRDPWQLKLLRLGGGKLTSVGAFPDGRSALMLVAARLRHVAGTKWGTRKYLDMERLAEIRDATIDFSGAQQTGEPNGTQRVS